MKTLTTIQIVLTVLVAVAYLAEVQMAIRVHDFAYADPARQVAADRAREVGNTLHDAVFIPWVLFTVFHVAITVGRCFYTKRSDDSSTA